MLGLSTMPKHRARLRGVVEVIRSLRDTTTDERIRIAHLCKDALLSLQGRRNSSSSMERVTGEVVFRGDQPVAVGVDETHLRVLRENIEVTKQMIQDISTIIAMRDSCGVLVVLGKCQVNNLRVAVVLKLESDQEADDVINDYLQAMEARVKRFTTGSSNANITDVSTNKTWPPFDNLTNRNNGSPTPVGVVKPIVTSGNEQKNPTQAQGKYTIATRRGPRPVILSNSSSKSVQPVPTKPVSTVLRPSSKDESSKATLIQRDELEQIPPPRPPAYLKPFVTASNFRSSPVNPVPPRPSTVPRPSDKPPLLPPKKPRTFSKDAENKESENADTEGRSSSFKALQRRFAEMQLTASNSSNSNRFSKHIVSPGEVKPQFLGATMSKSETSLRNLPLESPTSDSNNDNNGSNAEILELFHKESITPNNNNNSPSESKSELKRSSSSYRLSDTSSCLNYKSSLSVESQSNQSDDSGYSSQDLQQFQIGVRDDNSKDKAVTSKTSEALYEQLISFVLEDGKYIDRLKIINKAREEMPPQLQTYLYQIQTLCQVHKDILSEIKSCLSSCAAISEVLLKYREQLQIYVYYIMKASEVNALLQKLPKEFLDSYPTIKDDIRGTWKKLNFYLLHLELFLKSVPEEEKPSITKAMQMMKDLNKQADTEILLDGIKGAPYPVSSLGTLLLHNAFQVTGPLLRKGSDMHVLLFPTTIVITECKNDKYDFLIGLPIRQSYFGPVKQDNANAFVIEVNYGKIEGKKTFSFQARTIEVKNAWLNELTRLMYLYVEEEKQLQKRRSGWSS